MLIPTTFNFQLGIWRPCAQEYWGKGWRSPGHQQSARLLPGGQPRPQLKYDGKFHETLSGRWVTFEDLIVLLVVSKSHGYTFSQVRPSSTSPHLPHNILPSPQLPPPWREEMAENSRIQEKRNLEPKETEIAAAACPTSCFHLQSVLFLEDRTSQAP